MGAVTLSVLGGTHLVRQGLPPREGAHVLMGALCLYLCLRGYQRCACCLFCQCAAELFRRLCSANPLLSAKAS